MSVEVVSEEGARQLLAGRGGAAVGLKAAAALPGDGDAPTEGECQLNARELCETLARERDRAKRLEQRAAEAEYIACWLKDELDRSVHSVRGADADEEDDEGVSEHGEDELKGTRRVQRVVAAGTQPVDHGGGGAFGAMHTQPMDHGQASSVRGNQAAAHGRGGGTGGVGTQPVDHGRPAGTLGTQPVNYGRGTGSLGGQAESRDLGTRPVDHDSGGPARELWPPGGEEAEEEAADTNLMWGEMSKVRQLIEAKQGECMGLEESNCKLQDELSRERQKAMELLEAEKAQREELLSLSGELEQKDMLQKERTALTSEVGKLRERLRSLKDRDKGGERGRPSSAYQPGEMERLSMTVTGQLVTIERELTERTSELREITGPFLRDACGLLTAASAACHGLELQEGKPPTAPPLFKPNPEDPKQSLRDIIKQLQYIGQVLDSCSRGLQLPGIAARGIPRRSDGNHGARRGNQDEEDEEVFPDLGLADATKRFMCYLGLG